MSFSQIKGTTHPCEGNRAGESESRFKPLEETRCGGLEMFFSVKSLNGEFTRKKIRKKLSTQEM